MLQKKILGFVSVSVVLAVFLAAMPVFAGRGGRSGARNSGTKQGGSRGPNVVTRTYPNGQVTRGQYGGPVNADTNGQHYDKYNDPRRC